MARPDSPPPAPQEPQEEARIRLTADLPRSLHRRLKQAALDRDQFLADWLNSQR